MKKKEFKEVFTKALHESFDLKEPLSVISSNGWELGPIKIFGRVHKSLKATNVSPGEDAFFEVKFISLSTGETVSEEEFISLENEEIMKKTINLEQFQSYVQELASDDDNYS